MLKTGACIDVNFLAEKHGKNQRDTQFRCVQFYTARAARETKSCITTCSQLKDALIRAHAAVQAHNKVANIPLQRGDFYLLNLPASGTYTKRVLHISDIPCIYALRFDGKQLYSYPNSTFSHRSPLGHECSSTQTMFKNTIPPVRPTQSRSQLTHTMKKRRLNRQRL